FALLEALRADPRTAAIPIILLSARAGEEARAEGLEACADDYLVKPFAARELIARVNAHLTLARIRRETERALADFFENGVPCADLVRERRPHPARQPRRARNAGLCARGIRRAEHRGVSRGRVRRRRPPGATARRPVGP